MKRDILKRGMEVVYGKPKRMVALNPKYLGKKYIIYAQKGKNGYHGFIEISSHVSPGMLMSLYGLRPDQIVKLEATIVKPSESEYLGWIDSGNKFSHRRGELAMVNHKKVFEISFPYGSDVEVKHGNGWVYGVRLREI